MKKMNRLVTLLMCLLAIGGLAFAGGGAQGGSSAKTLELWHIDSTAPEIYQGAVDRFIKNNPDYKVNVSYLDADSYEQKLAVAMNSGILPDVFLSWGGGKMRSYADANLIADMTSYMNANNFKNKFLDASVSVVSYNGKIWGIPAGEVSVAAVFYNKDIFAKYNLQPPNTLRELEAINDTLLKNGIVPFTLANKSRWTGSMFFMYFATRYAGIEPFANAAEGKGSFTHPTFVYAGNKIQEWVNKKYFIQGYNSLDVQIGQDRQALYTGDAAMLLMGSWLAANVENENPDFLGKLGVFMWPRDEAGVNNADAVVGVVGGNPWHIAQKSNNKDKAFELIQSLIDDAVIKEKSKKIVPPMKGLVITNPIQQSLVKELEQAKGIQLWYDQSLSPEVSEVHKDTCQEIFGLTMTPETAAQRLQEAQERFLKNQ
ncbi:putative ABC transporter extracellular-binding protein YurO [Spirochaetia bacterium]|nr:putative ABC transporter extracellular-binding protein YurO [Spirochaetia bacterium]